MTKSSPATRQLNSFEQDSGADSQGMWGCMAEHHLDHTPLKNPAGAGPTSESAC